MARLMIGKDALIRDCHRRFKDSALTRVIARIAECAHLLKRTQTLLLHVNLDEPSFSSPRLNVHDLCAEGIGVIEAPRGTLIHKVVVHYADLRNYPSFRKGINADI